MSVTVVDGEPMPLPLRGCFVTGTDTEVGKTAISAGLLHLLGRRGLRVAGYKPVAAGATWRSGASEVEAHWHNDDVEALLAASTITLTRADVCPSLFEAACAPHLAARLEGRCIEPHTLIAGAHRLVSRCDALVVEGVGGFGVPLVVADDLTDPSADWGADDLAVALGLPVVLVVGLRLGCINHALLTAQAVAARGLRLVGWVANRIDPHMGLAQDNIETLSSLLQRRHGAPMLGVVEHLGDPSAARVADALDEALVCRALGLGD
jgi:dethiobiotin synthetase